MYGYSLTFGPKKRKNFAYLNIKKVNLMRHFYKTLCLYTLTLSCLSAGDAWKGDEYAKNSASQKSSAEDFISSLNLKNFTHVLDVGCGDGKITADMAKALPHAKIVGVDISSSMIGFAKDAFGSYPNLQFAIHDATDLDYQNQFDLITSFTVMHWVLEQQKALNGFAKALKKGGSLCIQMPAGLPAEMNQALDKMLASEKWKSHFAEFSPPWKFYQPDTYRPLVEDAGLRVDRLETVLKHEKFPTRTIFQGFVRQWFPYLRALPTHLKDPFLNELIDNYLQLLPPDEQGQVSFIVGRLELEASK